MIFIFESGRLGNQIFQYVGIKKFAKKNEKIIYIGFVELTNTFEDLEGIFILKKNSFIYKSINKYNKLFYLILKLQPFFAIYQEQDSETNISLKCKRRIINNVKLFFNVYFQSENTVLSNKFNLNFLSEKQNYIQKYLNTNLNNNFTKVFVHIRRGDYLTYPNPQFPAVLPLDWYLQKIKLMLNIDPNSFFIFCTDDLSYVKENFSHIKNSMISDLKNPADDLILMSNCDSGILSASSLSWWAAFFITNKTNQFIFYAPKFWIGHSEKKWHPSNIKSSFLIYDEVN